jgi:dienelactone hydrolase
MKPAIALAAGLLTVAVCAAPTASADTALHLPSPTGPHPVGTTSVYLKDTSRADPWVPEVNARELMVSLWYPATSRNGPRAQYMTPTESTLFLQSGDITSVPLDVFSTTRTNAVIDAEPAGRAHSAPLVVLSPGYQNPRATLTSLAEDLASNGYVVAAIDHTYENVATTFPDGRVTTCASCQMPHDQAFWEKLVQVRAADVSFVLDELTGAHPKGKGAGLIDPSRIAMAGHSAGGASAPIAMLADPRVGAGVDLDGSTDTPIPDSGLSRPFLFLGRESQYVPGTGDAAGTWERDWQHLTGWKRWLVVTGAQHASFTDIGLLADQLGLEYGATLPGARASEITNRYVRAFVDLNLRHQPQLLLDQASARFPEVKFCAVEAKTCA